MNETHGADRAPALVREAITRPRDPARAMRRLALALGLGTASALLLGAGAIGWLMFRDARAPSPPAIEFHTRIVSAAAEPTPAARSVPAEPAAAEPTPAGLVLAADRPIGASIPVDRTPEPFAHPLAGVAASPGPFGVLAAWTETAVYVSRDDGASFHEVLGGPGAVGDAALSAAGDVYVVRDQDDLGVLRADGLSEWRTLPRGGGTLDLEVRGDWLVWLASHPSDDEGVTVALHISDDGGRTWRAQTAPFAATYAQVHVEDSGALSIIAMIEEREAPPMQRWVGHVDGRPLAEVPLTSDYADAWGFGHDGWVYLVASECADGAEARICAVAPGDANGGAGDADRLSQSIRASRDLSWDILVATNGATSLLTSAGTLYAVDGAEIAERAQRAPLDAGGLAADGIGRAVMAVGGHVVRWSPAHGWRVLFAPRGVHFIERYDAP